MSEESASLVTLVESSHNLGSLPESVPFASGESGETSRVDRASLSLSDVSSDNLGSSEEELSSWSEKSSSVAVESLSLLVSLELASLSSSSDGLEGSP